MNEKFEHLLEDIKKLLNLDKVVDYTMRPPMGHSNFSCETEEYNETD